MGFASTWLEKSSLFEALVPEPPDSGTGIIIVIPSYDEPGINTLLDSLEKCTPPRCGTEVIIVINAPSGAGAESLRNNEETIKNIQSWKTVHPDSHFQLFFSNLGQPGYKKWGVGLARKAGMDEALRRFNLIQKPEGVIACLDGDCTVKHDYLLCLETELVQRPDRKACSVFFEHPVTGDHYPGKNYTSILMYELHLRYYNLALRQSGFPDVFHTVGSSMAVKALPYLKCGGMNRRQAGEDFYFVQKLVPLGGYFRLNSTTVYPSPRASFRVPFGTGASVTKLLGSEDNTYYTYNPRAFEDLGSLFNLLPRLFNCSAEELENLKNTLSTPVAEYLVSIDWIDRIMEIRENTSTYQAFKKRFFEWFNMFRIVKFLNNSHKAHYSKIDSVTAAMKIASEIIKETPPDDNVKLLELLREIERKT